jgi:hypothetical protein
LAKELIAFAEDHELEKLIMQVLLPGQEAAAAIAAELGFIEAATVHELYRGEDGGRVDLVTYVLPLGKWVTWWQQGAQPTPAEA